MQTIVIIEEIELLVTFHEENYNNSFDTVLDSITLVNSTDTSEPIELIDLILLSSMITDKIIKLIDVNIDQHRRDEEEYLKS